MNRWFDIILYSFLTQIKHLFKENFDQWSLSLQTLAKSNSARSLRFRSLISIGRCFVWRLRRLRWCTLQRRSSGTGLYTDFHMDRISSTRTAGASRGFVWRRTHVYDDGFRWSSTTLGLISDRNFIGILSRSWIQGIYASNSNCCNACVASGVSCQWWPTFAECQGGTNTAASRQVTLVEQIRCWSWWMDKGWDRFFLWLIRCSEFQLMTTASVASSSVSSLCP